MGKMIYDADVSVTFDDRVLAHLQHVIGAKLRRGEGFYFGWKDDPRAGDGRSTIWLHPAMSLRFKYAGSVPVELNRAWLEVLAISADSTHGLVLVPEPGPRV
jgi:hypothetical protein